MLRWLTVELQVRKVHAMLVCVRLLFVTALFFFVCSSSLWLPPHHPASAAVAVERPCLPELTQFEEEVK